MKKIFLICSLSLLFLGLAACSGADTALNETEIQAAADICGEELTAEQIEDITDEVMTKERTEKFPAVQKVGRLESGDYVFVTVPYGYHGAMNIIVVINAAKNSITGMRISEHSEGAEYVRDWTEPWFSDRFKNKSTGSELKLVKMGMEMGKQDILCITGGTISCKAATQGINAVTAVYREYALGESCSAVPRLAEGSPYEE